MTLLRRIDELHLEKPFYGSRRMAFDINEEGRGADRKRAQRLMRLMDIEALAPRPGTSKAAPGNKIQPYLLRGVTIGEPNHVWASDIAHIPMANGFLYLAAVIDGASRAVLAWRLSNAMDSAFCVEALQSRGKPRKFNTEQGAQFASAAFTSKLEVAGIAISMDARPFHGQHFDRAALALDQIRRGPFEGLPRRPRSTDRHRRLDRILQPPSASPGDGRSTTDGGLARRQGEPRTKG